MSEHLRQSGVEIAAQNAAWEQMKLSPNNYVLIVGARPIIRTPEKRSHPDPHVDFPNKEARFVPGAKSDAELCVRALAHKNNFVSYTEDNGCVTAYRHGGSSVEPCLPGGDSRNGEIVLLVEERRESTSDQG